MSTTELPHIPPKSPKHGPSWAKDRPTLGAVILFLLIAIAFGITTMITGFSNADVNAKIRRDEKCLGQIQTENLNRNRVLSELAEQERAALNRFIARVSNDVLVNNVADIPRAYEAYRLDVQDIDALRAKQGQLLSASALPSNCKLPLAADTGTSLPPISTTRSRAPLPQLTTATATLTPPPVTTTVGGVTTITAEVPGPTRTITITIRPGQPTRTITRAPPTVTVAMRPTRTITVTVSRTATVTRTVTRPPLPTRATSPQ